MKWFPLKQSHRFKVRRDLQDAEEWKRLEHHQTYVVEQYSSKVFDELRILNHDFYRVPGYSSLDALPHSAVKVKNKRGAGKLSLIRLKKFI